MFKDSKMNSTEAIFKRKWDALLFHCMDLSDFISERSHDDFFQTQFGRRMMTHALRMLTSHALGCSEYLITEASGKDSDGDEDEDVGQLNDIEEMLKRRIDDK